MRIKLLSDWNGYPPGKTLPAVADGVALLLIQRGIAELAQGDVDGDGKAEGGPQGQKKAFASPPAWRPRQDHKRK